MMAPEEKDMPVMNPESMWMFTGCYLHIHNGDRGDVYMSFGNAEELSAELQKHLSPSEIKSGVLAKLMNFKRASYEGDVKNSWRNFETGAYYEFVG